MNANGYTYISGALYEAGHMLCADTSSPPVCSDTNNGATDYFGDDCSW